MHISSDQINGTCVCVDESNQAGHSHASWEILQEKKPRVAITSRIPATKAHVEASCSVLDAYWYTRHMLKAEFQGYK